MDTPESPSTDATVSWWYYADSSNHSAGPVMLDQLRQLLASGTVTPNTYVCEAGVNEWRKLTEILPEAAESAPPALPNTVAEVVASSGPMFPGHPRLENLRESLYEIAKAATKRWREFAEVKPAPTSRPWHHRTATLVASSAICFPVSIVLIWTAKRFHTNARIILTVLCLVVIPVGVRALLNSLPDVPAEIASRDLDPKIDDARQSERLAKIMRETFGKDFRRAEVFRQMDGRYMVSVDLNASTGGWSSASSRKAIELQMVRGFKRVLERKERGAFSSEDNLNDLPINEVFMSAFAVLQDQYGTEREDLVYRTRIASETARKINWDRSSSLDFTNLWETQFILRSLRLDQDR